MLGFLKRPPSGNFQVMRHNVEVVSIIRDGKSLYTADSVRTWPNGHMEGQIIEIMLSTRSGNPYFVYYLCPDYYAAAAGRTGAAPFGGPCRTEEFRSAVSQQIAVFLVEYLRHAHRVDARSDIVGFSHNRIHTNVLTYISSLNDWYAIQHNDSEGDSASERKAAQVNDGRARITDVVAVDVLSPSAA